MFLRENAIFEDQVRKEQDGILKQRYIAISRREKSNKTVLLFGGENMTKAQIRERYKEELELVKERCKFSEKELKAYIEGYSDGQSCVLEELKCDSDE